MFKFVWGDNFQAAFRNGQQVDRHLANKENLTMKIVVWPPMIRSDVTPYNSNRSGGI